LALPAKYRRRLRTTYLVERFIAEIRRREKVIRIFPGEASAWPLVDALLAEAHEEWSIGRRYLKMDAFYTWQGEQAKDKLAEHDAEPSSDTLQPA